MSTPQERIPQAQEDEELEELRRLFDAAAEDPELEELRAAFEGRPTPPPAVEEPPTPPPPEAPEVDEGPSVLERARGALGKIGGVVSKVAEVAAPQFEIQRGRPQLRIPSQPAEQEAVPAERVQPETMAERAARIIADPNRPESIAGRFAAGAKEAFPVKQAIQVGGAVRDLLPEAEDPFAPDSADQMAALVEELKEFTGEELRRQVRERDERRRQVPVAGPLLKMFEAGEQTLLDLARDVVKGQIDAKLDPAKDLFTGVRKGEALLANTAAQILQLVGAEGVGQRLEERAEERREALGPLPSFKDDPAGYVLETGAEGLMSSLPAIAGGAAGAVIGQALIPIPIVGAVVGSQVGAWVGAYATSVGEIRPGLRDAGLEGARLELATLLSSIPNAFLEFILPARVVGQFLKRTVSKTIGQAAVKMVKQGGIGALIEFSEEVAQNVWQEFFKAGVTKNLDEFDFKETLQEGIVQGAAALSPGFFLGAIGGVSGVQFRPIDESVEDPAPEREGAKLALTPAPIGPRGELPTESSFDLRVGDIQLDPVRFQYKIEGPQSQMRGLEGVEEFDRILGGQMLVWFDQEAQQWFVVDGHNRKALADRTLGPDGQVTVQEIPNSLAPTAVEARAVGALSNIAAGRGTSVDAAKFFRDGGMTLDDLKAKNVPLTEGRLEEGFALSRLPQALFDQVINKTLPVKRAAILGGSGLTEEAQLQIWQRLKSRKRLTDNQLREGIRLAKAGTPEVTTTGGLDLFGEQEFTRMLFTEKAELSDFVKRSLRTDKALLKQLARSKLAEFGQASGLITGEVKTEAAGEQAFVAAQLEELYNVLSARADDPVGQALNAAAERLAGGENATQVKQELLATVRTALQASEFVTEAPGSAGVGDVEEGTGGAPDTGEEGGVAPEIVAPRAPEAPAPATTLEDAQTGRPLELTLSHGTGRTNFAEVYSNEFAAEAGPLLGPGRYTTPVAKFAARFGEVEQVNVRLENPVVIRSDDEWRAFVVGKVGWRFPNMTPFTPDAVLSATAATNNLHTYMEENNIDGLVIIVPETEIAGKTLWRVFDQTTIYERTARDESERGVPADPETSLEVQDDFFAAPAPAEGGEQFGLFGEDEPTGGPRKMQGFTEAQEQAARTVDALRERVAKGLATEAELAQYQEAKAVLAFETGEFQPRERTAAPELKHEPEDIFAGRDRESDLRAPASSMMDPGYVNAPLASDFLSSRQPFANADPQILAGAGDPSIPASKFNVRARTKIIQDLADVLDRPIRTGKARFRKRLGFFKTRSESIRLRVANDVEVAAHEAGHFLHKLFFPIEGVGKRGQLLAAPLRTWEKELKPLAEGVSDGTVTEGLAEFTRLYLTNRPAAREQAPIFYDFFVSKIKGMPDVVAMFDKIRTDWTLFVTADPQARLRSAIGDPPRRVWSALKSWRNFVTAIFHDFHPIQVMQDDIVMRSLEVAQRTGDPKKIEKALLKWSENAADLAQLSRGAAGAGFHFLEHGALDWNFNRVSKSLREIIESVGSEQFDNWTDYVLALHALDMAAQGVESGIRPEDSQVVIERFKDAPGFQQAADDLQVYQTALLKYQQSAGVLSGESIFLMTRKWRHYVPMNRVGFEDIGKRGAGGKVFGHLFDPIKRIKGSGRQIVHPIESIVKNTMTSTMLAHRQQVSTALYELSLREGVGSFLERVEAPVVPTKFRLREISGRLRDLFGDENWDDTLEQIRDEKKEEVLAELDERGTLDEVTPEELEELIDGKMADFWAEALAIWRPGELFKQAGVISVIDPLGGPRLWFEVKDMDLYNALMGLDRTQITWFTNFMSRPARTLRVGATSLSPEFLLRNPFKDNINAAIVAEYGFTPGVDFARGMYAIINKTEDYLKFRAAGGEFATVVDLDRDSMSRAVQRMAEGGGVQNVIKHPWQALQALSALNENATRVGVFMKAVKALEKEGVSGRELYQRAGLRGREESGDFATHGRITEFARHTSAFWNANLVGHRRTVRAFNKHPVRTSAKAFIYITIPTIILYMINRDDPEFHQLPSWMRSLFWMFKVPGLKPEMVPDIVRADTDEGVISHVLSPFVSSGGAVWVRLPRPYLLGLTFGAIPERIMEWIDTDDPKALRSLGEAFEREATGLIPFPTILLPLFENFFNYSMFLQRPIIPRTLEGVEAEEQLTARTSDVAILMSQFVGKVVPDAVGTKLRSAIVSPAKIDNVMFAWTGGLGRLATDVVGGVGRSLGIVDRPERPEATLADIPLVRGFIARPPGQGGSEAEERFYKEWGYLQVVKNTADLFLKNDQLPDHDDWVLRHQFELLKWPLFKDVAEELSSIRSEIRAILRAPPDVMSRRQKRLLLGELGGRRVDIASRAMGMKPPKRFDFMGEFPTDFSFEEKAIAETEREIERLRQQAQPVP